VTCGGRLRQETLSPTVDRRVRRTSRVVEEAESISCLCNYVLVFLLAFVDGWMDGWMGRWAISQLDTRRCYSQCL